MLHIVQVVLAGSAETPKVYFQEGQAQAAYVDCAKKYWAQSYTAYCESNGIDSNCFSSAQAFVASFDLADRSRLHYWVLTPEDAENQGDRLPQLDIKGLQDQRQRIEQQVQDVDVATGVLRDLLHGLLEEIAAVTGDTGEVADRPAGEPNAPRRLAAEATTSAPKAEAAPQVSPELFNSQEWKDYVETIKNMCGGNRSEFHLFTRHDWRQAVYSGETPLEYWDWVAATIDHYIEKAQTAGYAVVPDPDNPGSYRFRTPDGTLSEIVTQAEGEAWCRAGLHLEGK